MEIHIGDRVADVTLVSKEGNKVQLTIDGVPYDVDIVMAENGSCSILHEGKSYNAELIRKDWFMTLLDVKDYIQKKEQAYADYEDRMAWAKKMVVNIAKAGYFSSDRTIAEYNRDIWHL